MGVSFLFSFAFGFSSFQSYLHALFRQPFCFFAFLFLGDGLVPCLLYNVMNLHPYIVHQALCLSDLVPENDKTWSTGEGDGKPLQYSCLENPMNSMKRQKDRTLKEELPRSVGAQYAIGDQWKNNSRKNEEMEPKQKQHPVVDVTGDGRKVRCCKEQYCIGTWNVRSTNQGELEVIK